MLRYSFSTRLLPAFLIAFWIGAAPSAAQDARSTVSIRLEMQELASGSLLDLFAAFRETEGAIRFRLESNAEQVPVRFQTVVMKDGEDIGRSVRAPMPYFPGEMIMCPEAWDFISVLHQVSSNDGRLPAGQYDVRLSVLNTDARPLGEPGRFRFSVPER